MHMPMRRAACRCGELAFETGPVLRRPQAEAAGQPALKETDVAAAELDLLLDMIGDPQRTEARPPRTSSALSLRYAPLLRSGGADWLAVKHYSSTVITVGASGVSRATWRTFRQPSRRDSAHRPSSADAAMCGPG